MAAELKVSGRMTVKRLKENFKNEFGGTLRVYDGREKADDNATLASIRRNEDAKGGELVCNGHLTVGSFERRMRDIFGIKVQVATPDDWTLALDGITLAKLKDIPEKCSKADMESLVAYKRRAKVTAEVETETIDDELVADAEEAIANDSITLRDISEKAAIWITYTTDEEGEIYYLDSFTLNGALYSVDGCCEEILNFIIDDSTAAEHDCICENIEDFDDVESLINLLFYEFYKSIRYEHSRGETSLANDEGYFVGIYIDGKKIYERNITNEFDYVFEENSSESLDGDIEKIKNRLSELGLTEFTFYTEDYCGELDDDLTDSLNSTIEADLHFQFNVGDEGERYVAPRKVKIVDDELFFDLEEVEINYECGPEVLSNYEGITIEDILSDYWKAHVKKCLECMLEYMHNDEVIELNNESKKN